MKTRRVQLKRKWDGKRLLKTISKFNILPKHELKQLVEQDGPMKDEYTYEEVINEVNNFTQLSKSEIKRLIPK